MTEVKGLVAVDYESYYDSDYSLSNMSTYQYVSDPRFDAYLVAIHGVDIYGEPIHWVGHPKDAPWNLINGAVWLMHNMSFDAVVTRRLKQLGIIPLDIEWSELYDTADMAAYLNAPRSLDKACAALLGRKVSKAVRSDMKGKTYQDKVDEGKVDELVQYGGSDAVNTFDLWVEHNHLWPENERMISRLNFEACQYGVYTDSGYVRSCVQSLETQLEEVLEQIPWAVSGREFLAAKHEREITWKEYLVLSAKDKSKNKETGARNVYPPLSPHAFRAHGEACGIPIPASVAKTSEEWDDTIKEHSAEHPWLSAIGLFRSLNAHLNKARNVAGGIREDGTYAMQVKYFGGHTGRFSGGSNSDDEGGKFNPQNMPQGEMFGCDIRYFFTGRPGKVLCVVDYSQIEARVLLWLAGDKTLAEAVKREGNLYQAYARMNGYHSGDGSFKKENPDGYKIVKAQCLAPETLVLTDRGYIPIVQVRVTDRVWDGYEWCKHDGVVCNGERERGALTYYNGEAYTDDHRVLTRTPDGDEGAYEEMRSFSEGSRAGLAMGWRQAPGSDWADLWKLGGVVGRTLLRAVTRWCFHKVCKVPLQQLRERVCRKCKQSAKG